MPQRDERPFDCVRAADPAMLHTHRITSQGKTDRSDAGCVIVPGVVCDQTIMRVDVVDELRDVEAGTQLSDAGDLADQRRGESRCYVGGSQRQQRQQHAVRARQLEAQL